VWTGKVAFKVGSIIAIVLLVIVIVSTMR